MARPRCGEQGDGAGQPARIRQHRGRLGHLVERKPIRLFRKVAAEIDDLALAGGVDQNAGNRRAAIGKQPELRNVDALFGQRRAHLVAGRIATAAPPERRRAAQPRDRNRGVCGHAAASRDVVATPDLLAAA